MNKKEEIFTIGDKTTLGIITCFRLLDNEIMVDFDNKNSILLKSKQLQHIKQPLFTTEDGVDIFEGDNYQVLNKKTFFNHNSTADKYSIIKDEDFIKFSTKEKAEEYILLNKPCLSLNDLLIFFPDTYIPFKKNESAIEEINTKEIEKLVKSKIKRIT